MVRGDVRVVDRQQAALVDELVEAKQQLQLRRALGRWARYDVIALDEVGYVPLAELGAEFLFQVIADRAERAAVLLTTNLPFSEWTQVIPNARCARRCWAASPIGRTLSKRAPSRTASAARSNSVSATATEVQMKPLPDRGPTAVALLVGVGATIDVLADQVAQDREEVRHRLATTRFTATDTTDRDALLGHCTRLVYQLGELTTSQTTRPPQSRRGPDRGLDVISAEGQRGAAHGGLDLRVETGHSLGLPSTHPHNDTGGGRAEPRPQTPTQRPTGARVSRIWP